MVFGFPASVVLDLGGGGRCPVRRRGFLVVDVGRASGF